MMFLFCSSSRKPSGRPTGRRVGSGGPLGSALGKLALGVQPSTCRETAEARAVWLITNAAVERREACALRHWARNASLKVFRCTAYPCAKVRRTAPAPLGASTSCFPTRALFFERGGGALAFINVSRLFDIVKEARVPGAKQHESRKHFN